MFRDLIHGLRNVTVYIFPSVFLLAGESMTTSTNSLHFLDRDLVLHPYRVASQPSTSAFPCVFGNPSPGRCHISLWSACSIHSARMPRSHLRRTIKGSAYYPGRTSSSRQRSRQTWVTLVQKRVVGRFHGRPYTAPGDRMPPLGVDGRRTCAGKQTSGTRLVRRDHCAESPSRDV